MSRLYRYRLFCETENKEVEVIYPDVPSRCPNDYRHVIRTDSVQQLEYTCDSGPPLFVDIRHEHTPTQGNYRFECRSMSVAPNAVTTQSYSWPHPINLMEVKVPASQAMAGDTLNGYVLTPAPIGQLTVDASQGDAMFQVTPTVVHHLNVGHNLVLAADGEMHDVGTVLAIDKDMSTVCTTGTTPVPLSSASPTVAHLKIVTIKQLVLPNIDMLINIGSMKTGGFYVPTGMPITVEYHNNSETAKTVHFYFELVY